MKLYNTLTRQKDEFIPIESGKVKMYACGPTVYNFLHIGNARQLVVFDTIRRWFTKIGYDVTFVQNFTDVDDKMIKKANEAGTTVEDVANEFIGEYFTDAKGLGVMEATFHPKATENIDAIIELIKELVGKGYAYESGGDVYFRSKKFSEYGKLSRQPLEDLEAGIRVDFNEQKEDVMDFALWKAAKENEPTWESPWGLGRPGWHIECSAMATRFLGKAIDIHGGGQDLVFPHHENEIAQSECAHGVPFANYWVHNGFVNIDNQKMSKSLGNFFTIREIAEKYDYEVMRYFLLSVQYRNPINFSQDLMEQAKVSLERLYNCLNNINFLTESAQNILMNSVESILIEELKLQKGKFADAMNDDFNTANAISVLFDMVRLINSCFNGENPCSKEALASTKDIFTQLASVLGFLGKKQDSLDKEVEELIQKRAEARKNKDWATADAIRDKFTAMGIAVEDTAGGFKWKKI